MNPASTATLGLIGIAPLDLNVEEQNCTHNFIVCAKLKHYFILGLESAQRCIIAVDWDDNGKLFLRHKGKKIATSLKTNDSGQQTRASSKISTDEQEIHLLTTTTVTIPPYYISLVLL